MTTIWTVRLVSLAVNEPRAVDWILYNPATVDVQDLVLYMLEADQFVRGSPIDVIEHPWITVSISTHLRVVFK